MEKNKFNVVDGFSLLVKWRKLFVYNFLIFSIVAAIVSLLLPKWYTASCTLLPPDQSESGGLDILSMLGDLPKGLTGLSGMATPSDIYVAILKSRNVRDSVIQDLDLRKVFEADNQDDCLAMLDDVTKLDKSEEDMILIRTTARSKKLAVQLAESFVHHLDRVNKTKRFTSARYTREFIEKRLADNEADLRRTAEALRDFQRKHRVISIEEQTKAAITAMAELEAQIALSEVSYNMARRQMDPSHPEVQQLRIKREELKKQVAKLETGARMDSASYVVPFDKLPDYGLQYAFLLRDVEVQKAIYKLLMQQYEQARIREAKDTPTIQILDKPVEPDKRSKPKRGIIVISAALLSVFVSLLIVSLFEYVNRLKTADPAGHAQLQSAVDVLKNDWRGWFGRKK
ncbi:MAG: Tyrosine-protein kinase ptk [bacterium ADurb.Bin478]|nr:MAG: Tyrosine-protein kinase ptk [bacterium ADurb.Bin478]